MINVEEVKNKILVILDSQGPSLPIQIAKATELSPIFASAILSELVSEQKVKMSKLKYGSSPLYLIPGQEKKLESFAEDNLSGMEKKAYQMLREKTIIDDISQEPAMRVALRSINDFAVPIRFQDKITWKYAFISNEKAKEILSTLEMPKKLEIEEEIITEIEEEIEEPAIEIEEKPKVPKKKKSQKTNEEFLEEVKSFLISKDIELMKEIEIKKKEVNAIVRINSDLGKMTFLLIAKDKKKLNLADLTMAYQKATTNKMPCYLVSRSDPSKTTETFLEEHKNLLKLDVF